MDLFTSLIGSGAIGGSSAKRDRSEQLDAFGNLRNVFNQAIPFAKQQMGVGTATTAQGTQDLGQAGSFWKSILGGNRAATAQAVAPAANAINASSDAQARELAASGTARGGGTAPINQTREEAKMAQIDNMLFGARTTAAGQVADIGRTEAGVGLGETGQGLQGLNVGTEAAGTSGALSLKSRALSEDIHQSHVKQLSQSFEDLLSGIVPSGSGVEDALSKFGF